MRGTVNAGFSRLVGKYIQKKTNSNLSLAGLFFHDIMVLLTSYFIKINE